MNYYFINIYSQKLIINIIEQLFFKLAKATYDEGNDGNKNFIKNLVETLEMYPDKFENDCDNQYYDKKISCKIISNIEKFFNGNVYFDKTYNTKYLNINIFISNNKKLLLFESPIYKNPYDHIKNNIEDNIKKIFKIILKILAMIFKVMMIILNMRILIIKLKIMLI